MNRNAQIVRETLTMRRVAEFYGFTVNRSGCIQCPFHAGDHQASLHIYPGTGGFCCFGCGKKGSVIDFVMSLFDCSFQEAMQRLDEDFYLNLPIGKRMPYRERKSRQSTIEKERVRQKLLQDAESECERLSLFYDVADAAKRDFEPKSMDRISSAYEWAVKSIDRIKYSLLLAEEKRWNIENTT